MVYTADLSPAAERHESSNLSSPTKPKRAIRNNGTYAPRTVSIWCTGILDLPLARYVSGYARSKSHLIPEDRASHDCHGRGPMNKWYLLHETLAIFQCSECGIVALRIRNATMGYVLVVNEAQVALVHVLYQIANHLWPYGHKVNATYAY